jgi:hypothetical protein
MYLLVGSQNPLKLYKLLQRDFSILFTANANNMFYYNQVKYTFKNQNDCPKLYFIYILNG